MVTIKPAVLHYGLYLTLNNVRLSSFHGACCPCVVVTDGFCKSKLMCIHVWRLDTVQKVKFWWRVTL